MTLTDSSTLIGDCGLQFLSGRPELERGFHFARAYWATPLVRDTPIGRLVRSMSILENCHIVVLAIALCFAQRAVAVVVLNSGVCAVVDEKPNEIG